METDGTYTIPRIGTLQVVFKIVERCNINCSYCYYFNMGENTPLSRPKMVTQAKAFNIANWIAKGCRDLGIFKVLVSFHGGEPMMMPPQVVSNICKTIRSALEPDITIGFSIQTNGTILTEDWLEIIAEHQINIGISLDGDRIANDRFRRDYRGHSVFDRIEKNIYRLMDWAGDDPRFRPSTISVLDWRNDYRSVYKYLRGLGVRQMSFLLPDRSFDQSQAEDNDTTRRFGRCFSEIFDAWLEEDDPKVSVRQIREFIYHFQAHREPVPSIDNDFLPYQIIVMHSDGTVSINDSYIPALEWYQQAPAKDIEEVSLREFLLEPIFTEITHAKHNLAASCQSCMWVGLCKGGDLENRFSSENGFNNPSVYCKAYQDFFEHACSRLLASGYPVDTMLEKLEATLSSA